MPLPLAPVLFALVLSAHVTPDEPARLDLFRLDDGLTESDCRAELSAPPVRVADLSALSCVPESDLAALSD